MALILLGDREGKSNGSPAIGIAIGPNPAAVPLNDGSANREAQAQPFRLRGVKGVENGFQLFGWYRFPRIAHGGFQHAAFDFRANFHAAGLRFNVFDRFGGIQNQVHQHLLDLRPVGQNGGKLVIYLDGKGDAGNAKLAIEK
jgi:hypothetical protein